MGRFPRAGWWMCTALCALACDSLPVTLPFQQQGGVFRVRFTWGDTARPAADGSLFIFGEVTRTADVTPDGGRPRPVVQEGPVAYSPGARLEFSRVPPGDGYVVTVFMRSGTTPEAPTRYYGISAPFSLNPGDDKDVEVPLGMRAAPGQLGEHAFRVEVAGGNVVRSPVVNLLAIGPAARRVRISNDVAFRAPTSSENGCGGGSAQTTPTCVFELGGAGTEVSGTDGTWRIPAWNLSAGVSDTCQACTRTVYARFIDGEGVESPTFIAEVTLDAQAPTLSVELADEDGIHGLGQSIVVGLNASEEMLWDGGSPVLVGPGGEMLPLSPRAAFRTYAEWSATVSSFSPEGVLRVVLDGTSYRDLAGNAPTGGLDASVFVDRSAPAIAFEAGRGGPMGPSTVRPELDGGVLVEARFTVVEEAGGSALAYAGLVGASASCPADDAGLRTCRVSLPMPPLGEGQVSVQVVARDTAGNTSEPGLYSVTVDGRPPAVAYSNHFYIPPQGSVIADVTAARDGTGVRAVLVPDEAVDTASATLVATLPDAGASFAFALDDGGISEAAFLSFQAVVPAGIPSGDYRMDVSWSDPAGNAATLPLPGALRVLSGRPDVSLLQDNVRFTRAPTGQLTNPGRAVRDTAAGDTGTLTGDEEDGGTIVSIEPAEGVPVERLVGHLPDGGVGGAVPAGTVVEATGRRLVRARAWEWPATGPAATDEGAPKGVLLASVTLGDGGWPAVDLPPSAGRGVVLTAVDEAGNESVAMPVSRTDLVLQLRASPGHDVAHRAFAQSRAAGHPIPGEAVPGQQDVSGVPALAQNDAQHLSIVARRAWDRMPSSSFRPSNGGDARALVFDVLRAGLQLFAQDTTGLRVFTTDGNDWAESTGSVPPDIAAPAVAFDPVLGVSWVFGQTADAPRVSGGGPVYSFDGTAWLSVTPEGAPPPLREGAAGAFDHVRGLFVVAGGQTPGTGVPALLDDAWAWDGVRWTQLPSFQGPRRGATLTYDPLQDALLLVGGCGSTGTPVMPLAQVYRPGTGWRPVTNMGATASLGGCNGTVVVQVDETPPASRLAYLAADGSVLRGTWSGSVPQEGVTWAALGAVADLEHGSGAMVRDGARGRLIVVGLSTAGASTAREAETWQLDDALRATPVRNGPLAAPTEASLCVISPLAEVGLLPSRPLAWVNGGISIGIPGQPMEMHSFDGRAWRSEPVTNPPPIATGFACAPAVSKRGDGLVGYVLGGGGDFGTSITLYSLMVDSTGYVVSSPSADDFTGTPRTNHAMATVMFNGDASQLLVFGGLDDAGIVLGDTYLYKPGTGWARVSCALGGCPAARSDHRMVTVPGVGVLMVGGVAADGAQLTDAWLWNQPDANTGRWMPLADPGLAQPRLALDTRRLAVNVVGLGGSKGRELQVNELRGLGTGAISDVIHPAVGPRPTMDAALHVFFDPTTSSLGALVPDQATHQVWETWLLGERFPRQAALHAVFSMEEARATAESVVHLELAGRTRSSDGRPVPVHAWRVRGSGLLEPGRWEASGALPSVMLQTDGGEPGVVTIRPAADHVFQAGGAWGTVAVQVRSPVDADPDGGVGVPALAVEYMELRARLCLRADGGPCPAAGGF